MSNELRVVSISGDGFDLIRGVELNKSIIVSNGRMVHQIPVSDDDVLILLSMYQDGESEAQIPEEPVPNRVQPEFTSNGGRKFVDKATGVASL